MPRMDMLSRPAADTPAANPPADRVLALIREQLDRIRFGSIALSIHDGRVVQLEIIEKKRLA
jgi:hypothetical protein